MSWRDRAIIVDTSNDQPVSSGWRSRAIPVQEDQPNPAPSETFLDKALKVIATPPLQIAGEVGTGVQNAIQGQADRAGSKTAEKLGEWGVNPNLAAAAGTAVSMAPDIATMIVPGGEGVKGSKILEEGAQSWAQRALGITKAQLKTPFARGQAAKAAKTALEEDIIPLFGNKQVMAQRANALAERMGSKLGDIRQAVGPQPIDEVFNSLETLRNEVVGGRSGGVWDEISKKIDKAQESILGLLKGGDKVNLNEVEQTKNILRDTVNYMSDASSQKVTKQTTAAIERGVENTLKNSGVDVSQYKTAKQKFGAAKKMLEGLDVAAAAEAGNNRFGPIASLGGVSSAAMTGNPLTGILSMLAIDRAKKSGPALAANTLNGINALLQTTGKYESPLMALIASHASRLRSNR